MKPERWQKIEQLCHAALEREGSQRAAFLAQVCQGDEELRREVESLLAQEKPAERFLESVAAEVATTVRAKMQRGPSMIGGQLGSYQILSLLGSGGMGEVYQAHDTKLGRNVAIKVLPEDFIHDPERLARFQREARMLAAMNHPNIATIHGLEQSEGVHYLVMELVPGETLSEKLKIRPLGIKDALSIARQIAEALEAAHEKSIIHRDLKPANVKVTPEGRVKVLDFGLAKAFVGDPGSELSQTPTLTAIGTEDGRILGTPAYMSPEQARGKLVDKRTDIWAFGCVLYEMLTGSNPFAGDTLSDTIAAILNLEPEWRAVPETVPANIRRLLRRCFEKDSRRRLRDIGDAVIELDDKATDSAMPLPTSSVDRSRSRERLAWTLAAGLLASSVLILVRVWMAGVSPGSNAAPNFTRVTRLTSGTALDFGPAVSPDGKWVAYLSDSRGPVDLWVKFVAGGEAINLTASTSIELPSRIDIGGLLIGGRALLPFVSQALSRRLALFVFCLRRSRTLAGWASHLRGSMGLGNWRGSRLQTVY